MIYLTGDTHGTIDSDKLKKKNIPDIYKTATKDDYMIILGDFGYIWNNNPTRDEQYHLTILNNKPWTTLFIDGNHENHDRLNNMPVENWHGGLVHRIKDSVIHLMRGQVYNIDNKKFFVMGGANSIDKMYRTEGLSWWASEIPSYNECNQAIEKANEIKEVDYVLTHTCPASYVPKLVSTVDNDPTTKLLEELNNILTYKHWYFGHFHTDTKLDNKMTCLYNKIIKLGKKDVVITPKNYTAYEYEK